VGSRVGRVEIFFSQGNAFTLAAVGAAPVLLLCFSEVTAASDHAPYSCVSRVRINAAPQPFLLVRLYPLQPTFSVEITSRFELLFTCTILALFYTFLSFDLFVVAKPLRARRQPAGGSARYERVRRCRVLRLGSPVGRP